MTVKREDQFGELFEEWMRSGLDRRQFLRKVAVGTSATALSALITACDAKSGARSTSTPNAPTRQSGSATPAPYEDGSSPTALAFSTATSIGRPTPTAATSTDGSFGVAMNIEPGTLDVQDAFSNASFSVTKCIYEGLVGFDWNMHIANELASSWEASVDASEFTFRLAKGVKFHDGEPLNAQAVKASFERVLSGSPALQQQALFGPAIDHVDVVDDGTVRVVAPQPFAPMIATLAHPAAGIVSPAAAQKYGSGFGMRPVGTGPFRLLFWSPGIEIDLEANPHYWNPFSTAAVSKLKLTTFDELDELANAVQTGATQFAGPLHASQAMQLRGVPGVVVQERPSILSYWITLNNQKKPFDSKQVRQALNYGVDKQEVLKTADLGQGIVMDSVMGHLVSGYHKVGPYEYDPQKAVELLRQAGYPDGFKSTLWTSTANKERADAVQAQLAKIGVVVDVVEMNSHVLGPELGKPVDQSNLEMAVSGWSPSTGDADQGIRPLFTRDEWPPAGATNSFYTNPEVEKYVQEGLQVTDQQQRFDVYAKAQELIWEDAPNIFLYSPTNLVANQQTAHGVTIQPDGILYIRTAAFG